MRGARPFVLVLALCLLGLGLLAGTAEAKEIRLPLGPFGTAEQPSFGLPGAIAVDQESHDVYVADPGKGERQSVTVSASAGKFRLTFKGETTADIAFNAPDRGAPGSVQSALRVLPAIGQGVFVSGGPGAGAGSQPYVIEFQGLLVETNVEQLGCENGAVPLSGGSGCAVATLKAGAPGTLSRYHADGTPSNFSALGSNTIDGVGPDEDQVPTNHLQGVTGVAVDDSGGASDGDVYVAEGSFNEDNTAALHVVYVFASSGKYLGQITEYKEGPTASGPSKPLNPACGLAVDGAGNLYLGDSTISGGQAHLAIHKYQPTANPAVNADNVANFVAGSLNTTSCKLAAGAGPSAGYIFSSGSTGEGGEPEVLKLDAASGAKQYALARTESANLKNIQTVAVDPASGRVLAGTSREILEYDASGASATLPRGGLEVTRQPRAIAVDGASGDLYLASLGASHIDVYGPSVIAPDVSTEAASGVGPAAATLNGTISVAAGPEAHCHFQYLSDATYKAQLKAAEEASEKVERKTKAEIADAAFAGAQSAPCEPAGPFTGVGTGAVSAKVEGLAHETAYRFRIVGENSNGQNPGEALFFETFGKPKIKGASASEVTTTAAKVSGEVNPAGQQTDFAVQYVEEAEFLKSGYNSATSIPEPAEDLGSGTTFLAVSEQLSGLTPDTAYRFRIAATNPDGTTLGKEGTFATFAPPLGLLDQRAYELVSPVPRMGEVWPPEPGFVGAGSCDKCTPGWSATTPEAPMQSSPDGDVIAYEGDPFHPGLAAEANSYVSRRTESGWQTTPLSEPQFEAQDFKAFSPDLSKAILLQAEPPLSAQAPAGFNDLYLREEGGGLTTLITTKPPTRPPGTAGEDFFRVTYAGANAGSEAIEPFTHVVFQANDALTEAVAGIAPKAPAVKASERDLYEWSGGQLHLVNVLPGNEKAVANAVIGSGLLLAKTAENFNFDHAISNDGSRVFWSTQPAGQVFVREGGVATTKVPDPGKFLTAATDGSKVLLSDGEVYDLEAKTLTDLTGGAGGFEGMAGASEGLSRIYFVDTEALTPPEEVNGGGEAAVKGKFNLYLWKEGTVGFIGRLAALDNQAGGGVVGVWKPAPGNRLAQASADGRFLAFQSEAPLTGYDNLVRGAESCFGSGTEGLVECSEVFEYDALTEKLLCVSCNPSGVRPLGASSLSLLNTENESFSQPHNLPPEGEGRLFFVSLDQLTPADNNGRRQDVYEFEPDGVGSCKRAKGCLSLISSGQDPKDSQFINASATGEDVFFTTRAQLLPADQNDFMDLYDARSGGGIEEPPLPVPCEGEACKGPVPLAPEEPGALTPSFEGPGNPPPPKPCAKGKVRRHGKCLKRPRRHRHAHRKRGGSR